jgi:hypothetical protein
MAMFFTTLTRKATLRATSTKKTVKTAVSQIAHICGVRYFDADAVNVRVCR